MTGMSVNARVVEWIGETWVQSIVEQDFQRIGTICQPGVVSRLMTPRRVIACENLAGLCQNVTGWFEDCTAIQCEQKRFEWVGEKLAVFYRLSGVENGQRFVVEQQFYGVLRDGLIDQLSLLCSGFQPVPHPPAADDTAAADRRLAGQRPDPSASPQADALLQFGAAGAGSGSTCALLTPAIKQKLNEIRSGQVLEVRVNDPAIQGDIEAWCRLSGNVLLKMDAAAGEEYRFYLMKK